MSRTDNETGLEMQALLIHVLFRGEIQVADIYEHALTISRSSYYKRVVQDDYPNEDEVDLIVDRFDLTGKFGITAGEMKVRFGIVNPEDVPDIKRQVKEIERYLADKHPPVMTMRKEVRTGRLTKLTRLGKVPVNGDAPPL